MHHEKKVAIGSRGSSPQARGKPGPPPGFARVKQRSGRLSAWFFHLAQINRNRMHSHRSRAITTAARLESANEHPGIRIRISGAMGRSKRPPRARATTTPHFGTPVHPVRRCRGKERPGFTTRRALSPPVRRSPRTFAANPRPAGNRPAPSRYSRSSIRSRRCSATTPGGMRDRR